jgi:hypothetical protein
MRTKRATLYNLLLVAVVTLALLMTAGVTRAADPKKPNILIIWGDDIGYWNVSAYNQGMMGYKTPNLDRIAKVLEPQDCLNFLNHQLTQPFAR